jgi:hypothetical protein
MLRTSGQCGGAKFYEREDCKCANVLLGLRASNKGVPEMCDFSLYSLRSRPAQVGDKLVTHDFGTGTRGFAAVDRGPNWPSPAKLPSCRLAFSDGRGRQPSTGRQSFGKSTRKSQPRITMRSNSRMDESSC